MNPEEKIKQQKAIFTNDFTEYEKFKDVIPVDFIADLRDMARLFEKDAQSALQEGRLLRIGIIGQIKRGKSSFLNSLLFDGAEILPKAATPMTAALTKISYSPVPEAAIEFYSQKEWETIEKTALSVREKQEQYEKKIAELQTVKKNAGRVERPLPPEFGAHEKACAQLVEMLDEGGIAPSEYLGSKHMIEGITKNEDLVNELGKFVGAGGKFTPIVKGSELKLNIENLHDIEIVDTPGLNDPIHSRSMQARDFIGECDVVFFLSYCSQFLDTHDMGLLAQNIPDKGVDEIFLIGSIFDSAMLDCYSDYASIEDLLPGLTRKLSRQAENNINSIMKNSRENESHILDSLNNALPPIFISTRCHELSKKKEAITDEEERHSLNQLNNMYPETTFSSDDFAAIGNFREVQKKLDDVKARKTLIMSGKFDRIIKGYRNQRAVKLKDIVKDITLKRKNLLDGDIEKISARQNTAIKKLHDGAKKIAGIFERYSIRPQKELAVLKNEISASSFNARRINSETGSKEESYKESYEVSDSKWYNPFSWWSTRTESRTCYRTVNYLYANIHDAILHLEQFVHDADSQICKAVLNIVNIECFRNDIKDAIKGLFDFGAEDFDPEAVLIPLGNAVERITIPTIKLDVEHHINRVRNAFSGGEIRGDDLVKLRNEQDRTVNLILKDIAREIDSAARGIDEKFLLEKDKFIPELTGDMQKNVETLKKDLENKEKALKRYDEVLKKFKEDMASGS